MLVVLGADLTVLRGKSIAARFNVGALLSILGCASAALLAFTRHTEANLFNGLLVVSPPSDFVKVALLALTVFTILISTSGKFTDHVGEYLSLILLGTIGLMFLVSTEDLLMIFISLEFASLVALHPHRVQQAQREIRRSRAEILFVRRHVGGVSAVRLQPALRHFRLDQSARNRRRPSPAKDLIRCCSSRS